MCQLGRQIYLTRPGADRRSLLHPDTSPSQSCSIRLFRRGNRTAGAVLSSAHPDDTPTVKAQFWFSEAMAAHRLGLTWSFLQPSNVGGNYKNYDTCCGDRECFPSMAWRGPRDPSRHSAPGFLCCSPWPGLIELGCRPISNQWTAILQGLQNRP